MSRRRRPIEPMLDELLQGKPPKQIASDIGLSHHVVNEHFSRYVRESGYKTLFEAVGVYARSKVSKPPDGVD